MLGKVAKVLSVKAEDFVIDIYIIFLGVQNKTKKQLRKFINLNNNEVRKVINHVSTRWLNFRKCLERMLMQ